MKRLFITLALGAAGAGAAYAGDVGGAPIRMWNPATVATIDGTVDAVEQVAMGDDLRCVRLRVVTADGAIQVRVGPNWFVAERKLTFGKGERVQIKGSRLTFAGEPSMVAAEIVRGAERIVLRDGAGRPAWARN
jgi:hypothetical protein